MSYIRRCNYSVIIFFVSMLVLINALLMSVCTIVSYCYNNAGLWKEMLLSCVVLYLIAFLGILFTKNKRSKSLEKRDGFLVVTTGWILMVAAGALPYYITGEINTITNAFFESMSGFTTTGASILNDIEAVDKGILLWRSLTQWVGGMGIIVLTVAILPLLGIGGVQLFMAESPGITYEKLKPRIRDTAMRLWLVYVGLTALEMILLFLGGMSFYDSINHSLTTMATGGFSTYNTSAIAFSSYTQYIIIIFMFLAGTNFALTYLALMGKGYRMIKDEEFLTYTTLIVLTLALIFREIATLGGDYEKVFRDGLFQIVSVITTTGFVSADYTTWTPFAMFVIFLLLFCGGSAGSTAGGIKIIRYIVLTKNSLLELKRQIFFNAVLPVRVNKKAIKNHLTYNVLAFFAIYFTVFASVVGLISFVGGLDLQTGLSAAATCIGNVGPGFGGVGPVDNFSSLSDSVKWILSFAMLIGRLEIFTVLIILTPAFWRG